MSFTCKSVFNVLHELIDDADFQMTCSVKVFYAQQNTHIITRLDFVSIIFIQKVSQGVTDDPMFVNKILAM